MLCWRGRGKGFIKSLWYHLNNKQTITDLKISEDYSGHIHNTQLVAWMKLTYFKTAIDCVGPTMVVHQIKVTDN